MSLARPPPSELKFCEGTDLTEEQKRQRVWDQRKLIIDRSQKERHELKRREEQKKMLDKVCLLFTVLKRKHASKLVTMPCVASGCLFTNCILVKIQPG